MSAVKQFKAMVCDGQVSVPDTSEFVNVHAYDNSVSPNYKYVDHPEVKSWFTITGLSGTGFCSPVVSASILPSVGWFCNYGTLEASSGFR